MRSASWLGAGLASAGLGEDSLSKGDGVGNGAEEVSSDASAGGSASVDSEERQRVWSRTLKNGALLLLVQERPMKDEARTRVRDRFAS